MRAALASLFVVAALPLAACATDPTFESVLELQDTYDTAGPYRLEAYVTAPEEVDSLLVWASEDPEAEVGSEAFESAAMAREEGDDRSGRWIYEWPGAEVGTTFSYYLALTDGAGTEVDYPKGAPTTRLEFAILAAPE